VSTATKKIQTAAYCYNPFTFFGSISRSFEADELDPTAFKEALKQNFSIYLSPEELGAALKL
jgi:hypothetical protein